MNKTWYYLGPGFLLAGIILRQPLLLVIGLLVLLVILLIDAWGTYCLHDLLYKRQLSEQRVLFGEQITLSFSIENAKLLPLPWVEVEDAIPVPLVFKGRRPRVGLHSDTAIIESLFSPRWYERITRSYSVQCSARGLHTFGPTKLRSGDLFGFITRSAVLSNRDYLLVYPLVVPLTRFGLPAKHPFGDLRAPRRLLEDPSRVIGVRDYQYGDDLRRVHWKATARTLQLQSKIYEATTTFTIVTFLNVVPRLDTHTFGTHPELQELAICAVASIANWAIEQGFAVGFYANTMIYKPDSEGGITVRDGANAVAARAAEAERRTSQRRIHIAPANSEEQRKRIMETLARIEPYYGSTIEDVILEERTRLPAGATIVVVTSVISVLLLDALARVRRGGHAVALLFVGDAPFSVRLPGIAFYHIGGEETWRQFEEAYGNNQTEPEKASEQPKERAVAGLNLS